MNIAESISVPRVEERILRACKTLRAVPDPDKRFQWVGSTWPEVVRSTEEAYGYSEAIMPRFRPTPADISDYLEALAWARPLEWRAFKLIWWRSFDFSFGIISTRIHRTDETARRWYRDAIYRCWAEANKVEISTARKVAGEMFSTPRARFNRKRLREAV